RGWTAAGDQFLQGLQLVLVFLLDQWGQANARGGDGLGAGIAGALLLLPQHANGPGCGGIGRTPGLACQVAAATGLRNRTGIADATAVEQVVAGTSHVAD